MGAPKKGEPIKKEKFENLVNKQGRAKIKKFKKEFMPPIDLKTDPDKLVEFPQLVVAGHRVSPREADIFYTFHTSHDPDFVCKKFSMSKQTLWHMQKREWWKRWNLDQLKEWLDQVRNRYLERGVKLMDSLEEYLDNPTEFPSGHGQAIGKMIEIFLRVSPEGLRPSMVSKFEHEFEVKTTETVDININITSDKIKQLTPEQIDDWNRTGVMPQVLSEMKDKLEDDFIEAEFEDIEEEDAI
jgi:hypothetical protein